MLCFNPEITSSLKSIPESNLCKKIEILTLTFPLFSLFSAFGSVGVRFIKALTCLWAFEICGLTIS